MSLKSDNNYQPPTDLNVIRRQLLFIMKFLKENVWTKDKKE